MKGKIKEPGALTLFLIGVIGLFLFGSDAAAQLGPAVQYSTNNLFVGSTAIGDLNGDGRNDVVTIQFGGLNQSILIYYQNAAGGLNAPIIKNADNLRGVAIGDLNGDGKADLAVSSISSAAPIGFLGRLVIFYQDPAFGSLLPAQEKVISSDAVGDLKIADLNSDGRNDVVMLAENQLSIFYQNLDGSLGSEIINNHAPVRVAGEIHVADMDNDGRNDIILQTANLQFAVIKQTSSGTLSPTPEYYTVQTSYWPYFHGFAVGDVNGDGLNDVVVVDPGNDGFINIFVQNNQGTLNPAVLVPQGSSDLFGVEIADVNGDGLNDIMGDASGAVYVFYQGINNTFQNSVPYLFQTRFGGGSPEHQALSMGDVTGDGLLDAVVTWFIEGLYVLPGLNIEPAISVTPSSLDFGSVIVGSAADLSFTVRNSGGGNLTGSATTNAPFSIVSGGSYSLAPSLSQTVTIRFSPTSAAAFGGSVTFTGGGGTSKTVTGTGVASFTLTVSKAGSGTGTVTSSPVGINCGTDCSEAYATPGSVVTLTATAAAGSEFAGWSGGGCSGPGSCTVTINANVTVTAIFNVSICTTTTSAPIAFGETKTGRLSHNDCASLKTGSFADFYTFSGSLGQQIAIRMVSTSFDTFLLLKGPAATVDFNYDCTGDGLNSCIPFNALSGGSLTLPTTGTYTIEATSFDIGATGAYSLSLTLVEVSSTTFTQADLAGTWSGSAACSVGL